MHRLIASFLDNPCLGFLKTPQPPLHVSPALRAIMTSYDTYLHLDCPLCASPTPSTCPCQSIPGRKCSLRAFRVLHTANLAVLEGTNSDPVTRMHRHTGADGKQYVTKHVREGASS